MKKTSLLIFLIFSGALCFAKSDGRQFFGFNVFQLPTSTLNLNYSKEIRPFLTGHIDMGYTFDYVGFYEWDLLGRSLTDHPSMRFPNGYNNHFAQSGGYLKLGTYFNLRRTYTKVNYFRLGLFLTNSIVYEDFLIGGDGVAFHTLYIPGVSGSCGYEFEITSRIKTSLDFQLSSSIIKNDLSTSECFVPGMGLSGKGRNLYPMIIWNIKFDINKNYVR